ncbi:hypothetical protein HRbin16_02897 [bacterium HR16]|nr:hypothetical protein HRbin16_02897 [bacterium HR16]
MPERIDPAITEQDVARMTDSGSFQRGKRYFRSQAIINPVREGNRLIAECIGSDIEPYRVRITLGEKGIADFDCSCPRGGFCKHVVALALTYIHQPERFAEQEPLEERLARLSHEQLASLVKIMVERYPSLRALIPAGSQTSPAPSEHVDTEPFRQQIRAAVNQYVGYAERGYQVRGSALQTVCHAIHSQAQRYAEKGDWANAGVIYQAVIEELCKAYRKLWEYGESGEAGSNLVDAVTHLITCFEYLPDDDPLRQQWVQTLWSFIVTDMDSGGYADTYDAETVLIESTTAEEWQNIEKQILARLAEKGNDWYRDHLLDMVIERYAKEGREEELTGLIMDYGSPLQRIHHLIRMGRVQEAIDIVIREVQLNRVHEVVAHLLEVGAHQEAVHLMEHFASQASERDAHTLSELYEQVGLIDRAAEIQKRYLLAFPSLSGYRHLRRLCEQIETWQKERESVLHDLEAQGDFATLTAIAVEEGDARRALEMLELEEAQKDPERPYYYASYENLRLRVAEVAEQEFPEEAIRLYTQLAETLIGYRNRTNYAAAAELLTRVRALYSHLKREEEWQRYIAGLREQHSRLPALQDELNKEGL